MNLADMDKDQRRLIHFPIVHTETDLGALAESVNRIAVQRLGHDGVRRKRDGVNAIWSEIEDFFNRTPLPYPRVCLYQDGLPVCGMEGKIVSDLAGNGSRNHQLLRHLMERGARLMGTESPELLLQEHAMMQKILAYNAATDETGVPADTLADGHNLLVKRDRFIGDRINKTLGQGHVGVLFLGLLHDIGPYLARDIQYQYPLHRCGCHRVQKAGLKNNPSKAG